ncbi:MAG: hypothetical protein U5J64_06195 [Halobacteriales archaeon]|nr:hypothetical protein [Halobacteriales archaeon]
MPTLEEVYERRLDENETDGYFRVRAGIVLLSIGVFLIFFGGVVAFSETVAVLFNATIDWERWGVGAIFAGVGLPLAFTGVFVVVPAPRRDQAIAVSGILVAFLGVLFFDYAYPNMWQGDPLDLSPLVFAVYALGSFLMFGALFRSVLDIDIALPRSSLSFEYNETNRLPDREERVAEMSSESTRTDGGTGGVGVSVETNATDAEVVRNERSNEGDGGRSAGFSGDRYCGNCAFYEYAQVEGTSVPFCEYHDRELQDLEACDHHEMRLGAGAETHSDD